VTCVLTIYNPVVTFRPITFCIQQFYDLPRKSFMGFIWISGQTAIISPFSINWLVFVAQAECVYCAVRA